MPKLVLATRNPGKLAELGAMLAAHGIEVVGLDQVADGLAIREDGQSFAANALIKARAVAAAARLPALADDSGLCVDALDGEPGLHSARYGGPGLTDAQRVTLLLDELADRGIESSPARFVCAVALVTPARAERLCQATWEGRVVGPPRGSDGFGYDPIFELPDRRRAAELPADEKNRLSHRGQALRRMLHLLLAEPELLS